MTIMVVITLHVGTPHRSVAESVLRKQAPDYTGLATSHFVYMAKAIYLAYITSITPVSRWMITL